MTEVMNEHYSKNTAFSNNVDLKDHKKVFKTDIFHQLRVEYLKTLRPILYILLTCAFALCQMLLTTLKF